MNQIRNNDNLKNPVRKVHVVRPTNVVPKSSPLAIFPVDLTKTGGVDGDSTTAASYTYTVNDINGNQLATGVNPAIAPHRCQRPIGKTTVATFGTAFYNGATLVIVSTNEHPTFESC